MTAKINLTNEPVQITDGTNSAHVTVERGSVLYADSGDSAAWHSLRKNVIDIYAPRVIWIRAWGGVAEICVTTWTE